MDAADEVVAAGAGAHWIWNIADTQFLQATQILDWYHASEYVWAAASTISGEEHPERAAWAHQKLDALWESKVEQVLAALGQHRAAGAGAAAALSAYTTHRQRMDGACYGGRGLQIWSGNVDPTSTPSARQTSRRCASPMRWF